MFQCSTAALPAAESAEGSGGSRGAGWPGRMQTHVCACARPPGYKTARQRRFRRQLPQQLASRSCCCCWPAKSISCQTHAIRRPAAIAAPGPIATARLRQSHSGRHSTRPRPSCSLPPPFNCLYDTTLSAQTTRVAASSPTSSLSPSLPPPPPPLPPPPPPTPTPNLTTTTTTTTATTTSPLPLPLQQPPPPPPPPHPTPTDRNQLPGQPAGQHWVTMRANAFLLLLWTAAHQQAAAHLDGGGSHGALRLGTRANTHSLSPRQAPVKHTTDGTCGNIGAGNSKGMHCAAAGSNLCCSSGGHCGDLDTHCGMPLSRKTPPPPPTTLATLPATLAALPTALAALTTNSRRCRLPERIWSVQGGCGDCPSYRVRPHTWRCQVHGQRVLLHRRLLRVRAQLLQESRLPARLRQLRCIHDSPRRRHLQRRPRAARHRAVRDRHLPLLPRRRHCLDLCLSPLPQSLTKASQCLTSPTQSLPKPPQSLPVPPSPSPKPSSLPIPRRSLLIAPRLLPAPPNPFQPPSQIPHQSLTNPSPTPHQSFTNSSPIPHQSLPERLQTDVDDRTTGRTTTRTRS